MYKKILQLWKGRKSRIIFSIVLILVALILGWQWKLNFSFLIFSTEPPEFIEIINTYKLSPFVGRRYLFFDGTWDYKLKQTEFGRRGSCKDLKVKADHVPEGRSAWITTLKDGSEATSVSCTILDSYDTSCDSKNEARLQGKIPANIEIIVSGMDSPEEISISLMCHWDV